MISTKQIFWNVRRKVYEKGKSLHEASKEASIGVNTIAWMQNNYPGVYILGKLADYIGCPITDFFQERYDEEIMDSLGRYTLYNWMDIEREHSKRMQSKYGPD